ncbi:TetR/AcrR family transcriptional regulator [Nocardioides acrostichi]|uniref:TetR/AcrR family transcriptional regulator n=1 Tax=Nocardioides acrostichi TaxID=2784339 RepID=A0A930Y6N1_9ACTN|nr:TetR/AcrR family transcriptional regulator [Nocardioides acrostichi]MBF4161167.1 TetR/AcrR family transcriptional regulator [Nocardioides acrostichi]
MPSPGSTPAQPGRRPRGRPGHDRAAVLRRAIALFNVQGYDATSVSDLAADLGVTKSAVYHHFASKEDILAAALDEALTELDALVAAAQAASDRSARERLEETVVAAVGILVEHRAAVTLLLRVRGNSAVEQAALARRRHIDAALAALVVEAVDEGDVRADVPAEVISRLVFGMVNSLTDWYEPGGRSGPAALAAAVRGVLFEGLGARSRVS